ncbi:MAG: extracellular solute-binding protein [Treponema sp.]|jgi:putative aldouronate transport system substrate-binding protein|nr:extracellular solute-binding protein [Treponema sp.]
MIRPSYLKWRFWALFVMAAVLVLFTSCNKKGENAAASGDPDYPINISIFSMAAAQQPPADNKIYKWIENNLHVTFTWDILVGEKDQKIGVMIASGDYPDLLEVDSDKFYEAGALTPLDDLIDKYAPRLKKHYAEAWEKMKAEDGKVYVLPVWGVMSGVDHSAWYGDSALWVQKEVLKEFGYPKVKTVDEYFDLLIKYKERYPTIDDMPTIGFTILTYDWRSFCLINPPNFLAGYPNDGNGTVDPVTHEYKVFLYQDISKRWFKKLNEMNTAGLIDRSCFVDNYDQYLAKISSGRVLGFHDQAWQFQNAEATLANQGMYNRTYAPLPIVFDESIRPRYRNRKLPNVGQGIGISVKAKDPVRIIRFLDAQLADDVQKVIGYYGILGEDYQLDEDGIPYRTETQRLQQEDGVWILHNQAALWRNHAPKIEGSYDDGLPSNIADIFGEREALMKAEDKELWTAYGVESHAGLMDPDPPPNPVWFPTWQINTPDGSEAQMAWQKAEELYRKYLPRIIMGRPDRFEDLWQEYLNELSQVGLEKYEAFYQNAVNERIRKWSPKS